MNNRDQILAEINSERDFQDQKWGGSLHDDTHSPAEWIVFICKHASKAMDAVDSAPQSFAMGYYRRQMIRVAALAVAAIESIDRSIKVSETINDESYISTT